MTLGNWVTVKRTDELVFKMPIRFPPGGLIWVKLTRRSRRLGKWFCAYVSEYPDEGSELFTARNIRYARHKAMPWFGVDDPDDLVVVRVPWHEVPVLQLAREENDK